MESDLSIQSENKSNAAVYGGYDSKIFLKPVNLDFMCSICNRNK